MIHESTDYSRERLSSMRLLDILAQGRTAAIRAPDGRLLPGAERFKEILHACPIRYVLADEVATSATQLAYAEGDRLTSCLDLIHVPARSLWVEWTEAPRRAALQAISSPEIQDGPCAHRAGALLLASPDCRSGEIRTFWSSSAQLAYVSPMVCKFDLDNVVAASGVPDPILNRGAAAVQAPPEWGLNEILGHIQFSFDGDWNEYYRENCRTIEMRDAVVRANLGTCAFDPPMLFAFFLLLGARDALPRRAMTMDRLNRARRRSGKAPLLDHIEVSAPLWYSSPGFDSASLRDRRSPRLHHVRGHIVRRGSVVFWRAPHLRGSPRLGGVKTRTVELMFAVPPARSPRPTKAAPLDYRPAVQTH